MVPHLLLLNVTFQTPTIPCGGRGNVGGSVGMPGMMLGMVGMMGEYYNMYPWMGGMVPQIPGVSGGMTGMAAGMMGGMMPGMAAGMGGMMPEMRWMMMPGMIQGMPAAAGGSRVGVPQSPGDNVYRPYMDLLSSDSQSTPLETQFTGIETFSFEEFGISPVRESPTEIPPAVGKSKKKGKGKGKGKGTTSSSRAGGPRGEEEAGEGKRTIWSEAECVALAKAWVGVVEDPYIGLTSISTECGGALARATSNSNRWKGFVLKSGPSLFLASSGGPLALLDPWHVFSFILGPQSIHGSRRSSEDP